MILWLAGSGALFAQDFEWAIKMGGTEDDVPWAVTNDDIGNVYTTGGFRGTVDFDPGPLTYELTAVASLDIFISKVNALGDLVWVKHIGGDKTDFGTTITIDPSGNVLVGGVFRDTIDADPGPGEMEFIVPYQFLPGPTFYGLDMLILKLDNDGNFIWARQIGGNLDDMPYSIDADAAGDIFLAGEYSSYAGSGFQDSCDFDPGPGVHKVGLGGAFVLKLNSDGLFNWVNTYGGFWGSQVFCGPNGCIVDYTYSVVLYGLDMDPSGNVLTTGTLDHIFDFDLGPGEAILDDMGGRDMVVLKLSSSSDFIWVKQIGGIGANIISYDVAVDGNGDVISTGTFTGTVDFNPGSGTATQKTSNPSGNYDIFISKLNSFGEYVWAKKVGAGSEDVGYSISVDGQGNCYTTGWFEGKPDFDPGGGKYFLGATGIDVFILKLNSMGNFGWARKLGASGEDKGVSISVDSDDAVVTTGYFNGTVDFNPNSGTYNLTSGGLKDVFVQKMSQSGGAIVPPQPPGELDVVRSLVYPNPAMHELYVALPIDIEQAHISLFSMGGVLLRHIQTTAGNTLRFDVSSYPAGTYVVSINDGKETTTIPFVKN